MPFKLDSQTGQYDFEPYGDSGQQQPEVLIAAAPPQKKKDKPWWQQVRDSVMKGPGIGRYVQIDPSWRILMTEPLFALQYVRAKTPKESRK